MVARCATAVAFVAVAWTVAAQPGANRDFRFVLLGDRTGEAELGVFERVLKQAAAQHPAFVLTVGDSIQGLQDARADGEWKEFRTLLAPYKRIPFYLTPGNHDIWSASSEALFSKYAGHPPHYSFDYGGAHFVVLDNSRTEQFSESELQFLESDLETHRDARVKFIVSHRPSWILSALMRSPEFRLHRIAKKYGVRYVLSGHVHQMLAFRVDGVEYMSMASAGGQLRASKRYEDGWFFGFAVVDVHGSDATFAIHSLDGKVSSLGDWGGAGLLERDLKHP